MQKRYIVLLKGWSIVFCLGLSAQEKSQPVFYLAPQSRMIVAENQKQFAEDLVRLEEFKVPFLQGVRRLKGEAGTRSMDEEIAERVDKLVAVGAHNRDQFLKGRKILSWWRFYIQEELRQQNKLFHFGFPETELLLAKVDAVLKRFEDQFVEERFRDLTKLKPRSPPAWPENEWLIKVGNLPEHAQDQFKKIYLNQDEFASVRENINQWVMTNGVLMEALHIVYGLDLDKLASAFQKPDGVAVKITPLGSGDVKYVLLVQVTLNGEETHSFALKGFWPWARDSSKKMSQEIAALNLLQGMGVPLVGLTQEEKNNKWWMEEFIKGSTLKDFFFQLGHSNKKPEEIGRLFQAMQLQATKHFLRILFKGFSGSHFIQDPHLENIMTVGGEAEGNSVEVKMMDVGSLYGAVDTAVIDVGSIQPAFASEVCKNFYRLYQYYCVDAKEKVAEELPENFKSSLAKSPTELLMDLVADEDQTGFLTDEQKKIFITLLVRGASEIILHLNNREIQAGLDDKGLSTIREFAQELKPSALEKKGNELFDRCLKIKDLEMTQEEGAQIRKKWRFYWLTAQAIAKSNPRIASDLEGLLLLLVEEAQSAQIKKLAREILALRSPRKTPEMNLGPFSEPAVEKSL